MTRFAASLLSLSITLALSPAFAAQPADAPAFDPQRLSEMVKTLSADDFEGRGPATAGEKKTIDYVTAQMQAAGVQPGGDVQEDGTRAWTQAVPLLSSDIAGAPKLSDSGGGQPRAPPPGGGRAGGRGGDGPQAGERGG